MQQKSEKPSLFVAIIRLSTTLLTRVVAIIG